MGGLVEEAWEGLRLLFSKGSPSLLDVIIREGCKDDVGVYEPGRDGLGVCREASREETNVEGGPVQDLAGLRELVCHVRHEGPDIITTEGTALVVKCKAGGAEAERCSAEGGIEFVEALGDRPKDEN